MRTAYADFFSVMYNLQVFCLDSNHRLKHPLSAKTALQSSDCIYEITKGMLSYAQNASFFKSNKLLMISQFSIQSYN